MIMLGDIIPDTLKCLDEHFPVVISELIGTYFIGIKTVPEIRQEIEAKGRLLPGRLLEDESSGVRWTDPDDIRIYFEDSDGIVSYRRPHALVIAARHGYGEIVEALMRDGGFDISCDTLIGMSTDNEYEFCDYIVDHENFSNWNSVLEAAAYYNNMDGINRAIGNGADNFDGALAQACGNSDNDYGFDHSKVKAFLIKCGANVCRSCGDSRAFRGHGCFGNALGRLVDSDDSDSDSEAEEDDSEGGDEGDGAETGAAQVAPQTV